MCNVKMAVAGALIAGAGLIGSAQAVFLRSSDICQLGP
jgi:hypothetical protein